MLRFLTKRVSNISQLLQLLQDSLSLCLLFDYTLTLGAAFCKAVVWVKNQPKEFMSKSQLLSWQNMIK